MHNKLFSLFYSWLYNLFDGQIAGAIKKGLNGQVTLISCMMYIIILIDCDLCNYVVQTF